MQALEGKLREIFIKVLYRWAWGMYDEGELYIIMVVNVR